MGVGARYDRAGLLEAIVDPSAKIHPDYASSVIETSSGRVVQGISRRLNDAEIEVATSQTETVRLRLDEIEEQKPSPTSLMPAGLNERLTPREMADLIAHLAGLGPSGSGSLGEALDPREILRAVRPVTFRPIHDRASAFHRPVWFGPLPGRPGTNVVVEMQRGRIWLVEGEGPGARRTLFADLGAETTPGELTGITSLAFHPDFVRNRRYFLKHHSPRDAGRLAVYVVERRASDDGRSDAGVSSKLILKIPVFSEIHNGGHLAFGPDGFLYVGMGDTGPQEDPRGHGQDLGVLLGKMLRLDVDHAEGDRPYAIPRDNPFRNRPGALPEVWARGLREPWRFGFDPATGDLWVGDVGQGQYEEVTILRAGENHGWNVFEGLRRHSDRFASADSEYVPPVFAYSHRVGPSVTGGFVYRGSRHPGLVGKYVFGDYESRRVWALEQRDRRTTSIVEIGRAPDRITSFGLDHAGEIHMLGYDTGMVFRLDPSGADLAAAGPAREVVPTSRREGVLWRFTTARPPASWAEPGFDDASWAEAPGGFGTRGTPGAKVRTEWRTSDIWLRREIHFPDGIDPASLALLVHHDEDAEIFVNGVLAARLPGFGRDYDEAPIGDAARAAIRPGRNTLAVHCRQVNGGQYVDVGLVETGGRP
jgi:putative heme-binding domain-containing protein